MLDIFNKKPPQNNPNMQHGPMTAQKPAQKPVGNIIDSNERQFAVDVIQESMARPVIVDFWAPWCGPCKQLGPVLEKLVGAENGKVLLVKINVDENQMLAQQLRIQSIPMVYAFVGGQPVDGFAGALPESQLKQFIQKLLQVADKMGLTGPGGDGDDLAGIIAQAQEFLTNGESETALEIASELYENDRENPDIIKLYISACNATQAFDTINDILANVPKNLAKDAENWPETKAAKAAMQLHEKSKSANKNADANMVLWLRDKNIQAGVDAALSLSNQGNTDEAIDVLCDIFAFERMEHKKNATSASDELVSIAKQNILLIFESLGHAHASTIRGRKKLSSIMFS